MTYHKGKLLNSIARVLIVLLFVFFFLPLLKAEDVDTLIQKLKDENPFTRRSAAEALGKIGDPRAVEPLIAALRDDKVSRVRKQAADALREITGKNFGEDYIRWQEWWEKNKKNFSRRRRSARCCFSNRCPQRMGHSACHPGSLGSSGRRNCNFSQDEEIKVLSKHRDTSHIYY